MFALGIRNIHQKCDRQCTIAVINRRKPSFRRIPQSSTPSDHPRIRVLRPLRNVNQLPSLQCYRFPPNILYCNARSLRYKTSELSACAASICADIIGVSETWLNDAIDDESVSIPDLNIVRCDRPSRTGGGCCLYIRDNINYKKLSELKTDTISILTVMVQYPMKNVTLSIVYHPPNCDNRTTLDYFNATLTSLTAPNDYVVIFGDFNRMDH